MNFWLLRAWRYLGEFVLDSCYELRWAPSSTEVRAAPKKSTQTYGNDKSRSHFKENRNPAVVKFFIKLKINLFRSTRKNSIVFGLCVPAVCSMKFLQKRMERNMKPLNKIMSINLREKHCQREENASKLTTIDWVTM